MEGRGINQELREAKKRCRGQKINESKIDWGRFSLKRLCLHLVSWSQRRGLSLAKEGEPQSLKNAGRTRKERRKKILSNPLHREAEKGTEEAEGEEQMKG